MGFFYFAKIVPLYCIVYSCSIVNDLYNIFYIYIRITIKTTINLRSGEKINIFPSVAHICR